MNISRTNVSDCTVSSKDAISCSLTLMPKILVSDETRILFQWVVYAVMVTSISSFGSVANIINIMCFVRQGLKDPVNVSLLGLAISDLGVLITSLLVSIGYNPALLELDLPLKIDDLQYYAFASPYLIFTGTSSWFTALIAMERCLCIMLPLKVKNMITPRRIIIVIVSVFILTTIGTSPLYFVSRLAWRFYPDTNTTILQLIYTDDRQTVEQIFVALNNVVIPFSAYVTIIICTIILVVQLRNKTKWRVSHTAHRGIDTTSVRDQRVSKMVTVVSTLFVVCFSPTCVCFLVMFVMPELAIDGGPNLNVVKIFGGVSMLLQTANSAANIFIYYHMSSRYRSVLQNLLYKTAKKQRNK